jgi:hypothetical protein
MLSTRLVATYINHTLKQCIIVNIRGKFSNDQEMGSTEEERKFDGRGSSRSGASLQDNQTNRIGGAEGSAKTLCQTDKSGVGGELAKIDV